MVIHSFYQLVSLYHGVEEESLYPFVASLFYQEKNPVFFGQDFDCGQEESLYRGAEEESPASYLASLAYPAYTSHVCHDNNLLYTSGDPGDLCPDPYLCLGLYHGLCLYLDLGGLGHDENKNCDNLHKKQFVVSNKFTAQRHWIIRDVLYLSPPPLLYRPPPLRWSSDLLLP